MTRELFIAAMYAALRMHYAIDRLEKIGFDIERGAVKTLCEDLDKTMDEIGKAMGMQENSAGYTDVQWWMEGIMMDHPYSATDADGKKFTPKTPEELWEMIKK